MTTQVSVITDQKLKEKALEKAKEEGLTLKAFLTFCLKAYVDGKMRLGVIPTEEPEIEEIIFDEPKLLAKAAKLAKALR